MIHFEWPLLYQMTADVEYYRYERCGFLFGHEKQEHLIITKILPVPNIRHSDKEVSYEISSSAFLHAEEMAVQTETKLLGMYHSHPNHPAVPSEYDWVSAQPNFIYTIISVRRGEVCGLRVWQLNERNMFVEKMYDFIASSGKPPTILKMNNSGTE
jgi:proteasome lid subunit RPN8/RPN11